MRSTNTMKWGFIAALMFLSACAHTYVQGTGLPADVADRFIFHVRIEAQERGLRTATGEEQLSVYAPDGTIRYYPNGDEILASFTIPNRSGKNANYYRQKQTELRKLNDILIDGARERARSAQDFAY